MRSALVKTLFGIIVCICLLPATLWAQADPNAPWDPNAHLFAYPVMMAKTAVLDPNGLIGLCTHAIDVLILAIENIPVPPLCP